MVSYITLRIASPMASLRGAVVGNNVAAQPIPSPSMLVGLLGASLGIDRREGERLNRIQDSIEIGWLMHREPTIITDYQTADITSPHMTATKESPMWAHDGKRLWTFVRGGGDSERKVALRDITCDVDLTAVVQWTLSDPSADEVLAALRRPKMMLYIGSRWALPAHPVAGRVLEARTMKAALREAQGDLPVVRAYIPSPFGASLDTPIVSVATRDFKSRRFGGSFLYSVEKSP
jgi:CRISPR system Cascade subunit CasD